MQANEFCLLVFITQIPFLIVKLFFYCDMDYLQCQFPSGKIVLSLSLAQMVL